MAVTLAQICDAVESTLGAAASIQRSQSYNELTEGIQPGDCPTLQVYWERLEMGAGTTDRHTFGGRGGVEATPRRIKRVTVHADYYARQRSHIDEDMAAVVAGADEIIDILEAQDVQPYFGLADVKAWTVLDFSRVTFTYTDPNLPYAGFRVILSLELF